MAVASVVLAVRAIHLAAMVAVAEGVETPMTLHERVTAAVEKRLAVAQAAWKGNGWRIGLDPQPYAGSDHEVWTGESKPGHTPIPIGRMWNPPTAAFIAANDPARIIRDCRRDLKVLARHGPHNGMAEPDHVGEYCGRCSMLNQIGDPYPCPDVLDLAEAYEIGVDDGDG
jgi:hypothetical protein